MDKTDYEEPRCPLDNSTWVKNKITAIPSDRVIAKEDEYLAANDYAAAEKHLLYWLEEAKQGNDERGRLLVCSELMGLYRKCRQGDKAKEYARKALEVVEKAELQDTTGGATAFLNAGTVYKAFGEPERSLELFEKARAVYEKEMQPDDIRKAGLYNNMALTLVDLGRFEEARKLYISAIELDRNRCREDEAITWLNLADCAAAENGAEESEAEIQDCLDRAETLLDAVPENERTGYHAFVCEKCAPVFDYYGYFISAGKFRNRAEKIYAGNEKKQSQVYG